MTNTNRNVWVFVEQEEGKIADVALELLSKGRELADTLGGELVGLLGGHQVRDLAETVIHHGADRVLLADDPELELYRTLPYARIAISLIKERKPYIVLVGASHIGRDFAPRVASAVRAGLTAVSGHTVPDHLLSVPAARPNTICRIRLVATAKPCKEEPHLSIGELQES